MKKPFLIFLIGIVLWLAGCQKLSIEEQRALATQSQERSLLSAQEAVEASAHTLCNINFEEGKQKYIDALCTKTTNLACVYFTQEVDRDWDAMQNTYNTPKLVCEWVSSDFIEESVQFGFPVQVWFIRMVGTIGWPMDRNNRDYWLQMAYENGSWKLNRILSYVEISFYQQRYQSSEILQPQATVEK